MKKEMDKKFIIIILSVFSGVLSIVTAYAVYMGGTISDITVSIWSVVFSLLVAFWTSLDAKTKQLYKPFEYSFFVFIFWPLVLPYHLIKTRGHEGFLMYAGICGLYLLPLFFDLFIWVYFVQ